MALLCNGFQFASSGVQNFGATVALSAYPHTLQGNFSQTGRIRNITAGQGITNGLVGIPSGYRHPAAWMMPQKPGALAARNQIIGSGGTTSTAQSGYNIAASVTGSGGVINTDIGLIVSIAAALTASGGISSAATEALAGLVASLTGSSSVTATAAGLADLGAALLGSGLIDANNTALMDIAAEIRGYGDLTPEGIRDAVWNAILANYPNSGSAGLALSTASSGGVDPSILAAAVWAYVNRTLTANPGATVADITNALLTAPVDGTTTLEESLRLQNAVIAGNVSGAGTGTETFRSIADDKDRVVATVDSSGNRTAITRDLT